MSQTFKRTDLANALAAVKPALSDGKILKILDHFCFTGNELFAYNDSFAIMVPFETEFVGAAPNVLAKLIDTVTKEEVVLSTVDNLLVLTAPPSPMKTKLPVMPPEDFTFTWPEQTNKTTIQLTVINDFITALEHCMRSVGKDGHRPEQRGITLVSDEDGLALYSTDAITLTRARVPDSEIEDGGRAILPTAFCKHLIEVGKVKEDEKPGTLTITDNYCTFVRDGIKLYGRLLDSSEPTDLGEVVRRHLDQKAESGAIPIPANLEEVLQRAIYINDAASTGAPNATFTVTKEQLRIDTATDRGENKDLIKFKKHPDVSANFDAKRIQGALGAFDKILITKACVAMLSKSAVYLVSAVAK